MFKLSIFKVLFKEEYEEVIKNGDIRKFIFTTENEFIKAFFNEIDQHYISSENKEILYKMEVDFYNSLIFSEEVSEEIYLEVKNETDQLIKAIDSSRINNTETIDFDNLTKYLKAINYVSGREGKNKNIERIQKFTNLTLQLYNQGTIAFENIFELLGDANFNILIEYPFFYKAIDNLLSNQPDLYFNDKKSKTIAIHNLKSLEGNLLFKYSSNLQIMIFLHYFEDDKFTLNSIRDPLMQLNSVKELNKLLVNMLKLEIEEETDSVIMLRVILEKVKSKVNENYQKNKKLMEVLKYNYNELMKLIEILHLNRKLIKKINDIPIDNKAAFEVSDRSLTINELKDSLTQLFNLVKKDGIKLNNELFNFFRFLLRNMYENIDQVDNEDFVKVNELFLMFEKTYDSNEKVFIESSWQYCILLFAKIEEKKKNN